MARKRSNRNKIVIPSKYILLALSVICIITMVLSYATDILDGPPQAVAGYTVIPFQKAISYAGNWLFSRSESIKELEALRAENEELKETVNELSVKINDLTTDKYELSELRQLMALDERYSDYPTVGARVIGKDAGNWYSTFLIDKGTNDGIKVNMNVLAGSGLVGIVTSVGPNWATVRSIIDDESNISAMVLNTSDTMIVTGDLELYANGTIKFSELRDEDDAVSEGDQIVTSQISSKYLPGISIGYIKEINSDSNNLTKSGFITPVVDFEHIDIVLVVTQMKQTKE
ncbi:MAG: rod shape-determining protein MreC [Lachnospiraceae bacterium]|nr:rod shape-determining protein MreC [Lachnospiraceae bacterium]MBR4574694.1 rod shape-determining protein MreC [Lachnospiraceae bacterium]